MNRFREMVDHVKTYGAISGYHDKWSNDRSTNRFFNAVSDAKCFVFEPTVENSTDMIGSLPPDASKEFDSPFDTICIEMFGENNYITVSPPGQVKASIAAILYTDELKEYFVYTKGEKHNMVLHVDFKKPEAIVEVAKLVSVFVKRINTETVGACSVNEKIKIKSPEGNKFVKINQVIYVAPGKVAMKKLSEDSGRSIDYSHRFFRRGHWRTLEGAKLGKNRKGEYIIPGKTWVLESVVGPEDKPLIHKTRVVQNE